MVDLASLKRAAEAGDAAEEVPITRRCLAKIVEELAACRASAARPNAFGLGPETAL
jgi:hypothetical protein